MENKKILFITSSYPFGKGESFIIPEIEEFSKFCKLAVVPTHPRGEREVIYYKIIILSILIYHY